MAPFFNWLFIYGFHLGLIGAALALAAVNAFNSCLLAGYIVWHNKRLSSTAKAPWLGW